MNNVLEIKRPQTDWSKLGALLASPIAQQQEQERSMQNALAQLVFKSQLDQQAKMNELEMKHQNTLKTISSIKDRYPDQNVRIKTVNPDGEATYEILTPKQQKEEQALQRQGQLGGILSYIQKASQEGASPTVYREAAGRFDTPEEIKSIMGAYSQGTKLRPKRIKIQDIIKKQAFDVYQQGDRSPETLKALGIYVSPVEALQAEALGFGGGIPKAVSGKGKKNGLSLVVGKIYSDAGGNRKKYLGKDKSGKDKWGDI